MFLILLRLVGTLPGQAGPAQGSLPSAEVAADGQSFSIVAPGFVKFRAGFAAKVEIDGQFRIFDSRQGVVLEKAKQTSVPSPYGSMTLQTVVVRFEEEQIDLLFQLGIPENTPQVIMLQAGVRNQGSHAIRLAELIPLMMEEKILSEEEEQPILQVASPSEHWLLTGLHAKTTSVSHLHVLPADTWIHEQGCLYRKDEAGFFFGPTGQPVSYLAARFSPTKSSQTTMTLVSAMDRVRVDAGQTRWGQQAGLFFEPPRQAMNRWADLVVRTHGARTHRGALTGWSSVYSPERIARGKNVRQVIAQIPLSNGQLRPDVIQIGENFETEEGKPIDIASFYPEGYPDYAKQIAAVGSRPGMKLDFDLSRTNFQSCLADVKRAVQDGFSYLKIGYHLSPAFRQTLAGGDKTSLELAREHWHAIRAAAGEETYILFCQWFTDRATLGFVDASRTGPVTTRRGVRNVMPHVLLSYHLNHRWFAIDNDCFYMATELEDISPVVGGWPLARTWISMVGLSCGAAFTSDTWDQEKFQPYWRNVEVLSPPARERTEVLDIGTIKKQHRMVGHVHRDWGNSLVALLWNPSDQERTLRLDFANAGLDAKKRYAVWSFWENRYLGLAQEFWTTPPLATSASQHLCFTPMPADSRPTLIGSNLHIYCGAAEMKSIHSSRTSLRMELTDAGARAGDLFVYSRFPLIMKSATGLLVTAVDQAGENVWRIRIRDRVHGATQHLDFDVLLPVTRQWWFWSMMVFMVFCLIFAAWRYVAWMKLDQKHMIALERTRIARDLHDDLGASLARIGILTDLVEQTLDDPDQAKRQLGKIYTTAHELTRQLDQVVWTVDPRHDSLESFARHLHGYAQEYLSTAGIRCQFSVIEALPEIVIASPVRHELIMMIKEVLHNVVSHAHASAVVMDMQLSGKDLVLEIVDNGKGMPAVDHRPAGNGRENIDARARKLHAEVTYRALIDGKGTLWQCRIPLSSLSSSTISSNPQSE